MLFSKAVRLFGLLASSGVATSATVGMIIFGGSHKPLIDEKSRVLENIEVKINEFKNEDIFYSEDGTNDGTKRITKEEFEANKAKREEKSDLDQEKGESSDLDTDKESKESVVRNEEEKGILLPLPSKANNIEGLDKSSLLMPALPTGSNPLELKPGEEKHFKVGDNEALSPQEKTAKKEESTPTPISGEAGSKQCKPCLEKEKQEALAKEKETQALQEQATEQSSTLQDSSEEGSRSTEEQQTGVESKGDDADPASSEEQEHSSSSSQERGGEGGVLDEETGDSELGKKEQLDRLVGLQGIIFDTLEKLSLKVNL